VRDLAEAWAFVEACRTSGHTLDLLMLGSGEELASGLRAQLSEPARGPAD
jgi:hypothetical protein